MNCIHLKIQGNTTRYYFCSAKKKAINEYECRDCLLKIESKSKNEILDFIEGIMK